MKPYGLLRKIKHFKAKKDYHLHSKKGKKIESWWEDYSTIYSRTTMKRENSLLIKRNYD